MNETRSHETADSVTKIGLTESKEESFTPNITVWLVDDNDSFRSTLAHSLSRKQGIQCLKDFSSPDAALSALASQIGPDVILLDVEMRDRNGLDAIGPIKALSRATQVLMLTTFFDPQGCQRALADGASDFLLKSYSLDEIVRRMRNPKQRVQARRRRPRNPDRSCTESRSDPRPGRDTSPALRGGLKFFRKLIG